MKRLFVSCCFVFYSLSIFAQQEIKTELKKVNQAYRSADNLAMDVSVSVFKDKNDKTGSLLGSGNMKKSGTNYYSKFGKDELLINDKGTLIIDHQEKQITYFENNSGAIKNAGQQFPDIDSLLGVTDSIAYKGEEGDSKHFSFYEKNKVIYQTDIYVNKKTCFVKRIIYYYKENNNQESVDMYKVVIDYKNIKLDKQDANAFSEKKFVIISGHHIEPAAMYQTYKLKLSENE